MWQNFQDGWPAQETANNFISHGRQMTLATPRIADVGSGRTITPPRYWVREDGPPPALSEIRAAVGQLAGVTRLEFISHRRARRFAEARKIYYYLAVKLTMASFPMIGNAARKHHSTVIHGKNKIIQNYSHFRERIIAVCNALGVPEPPHP